MVWCILAYVMGGMSFAADEENEVSASDEADGVSEEEEPPKWDVNAPPGEPVQAKIDTTTGTWMSVDVSPDGSEIVFDLLGDIYVLPIEGGEAIPITSGMAWDMQPVFSPDGSQIAFTSDRGGGDNLWRMDRQGKELTAVTEETFRLLNSPAWSPDGQYLVGRKHFTSARSLGAGEIWMYHLKGGSGLPLTKKVSDQKDLGEPAFSPDGQYVYFSQDVSPGANFQYNKDPNGTIYAIQRVDRHTGKIERVAGGQGGSIRPTPSPDGGSLAFVRRSRTKSVLMVRDLASGAERPLWDGLDRDMQETWAIHGVYPHFSWTPDGKSIVIWAQGGLRRIDVTSGAVKPIPFHVKDSREIRKALRVPVEVSPATVDAKMIRGARVSPDGSQVVYQALGQLWLRSLPAGTPKRLTREEGHFEFDPVWSRDGSKIAYATWDDQALGSIRWVAARGGKSRAVATGLGHYRKPEFSPDGETLVYRRISGGWLRSPLWSSKTGIYKIGLKSKTPERIHDQGAQPHFGTRADELYFVQWSNSNLHLKSIHLQTKKVQDHAFSDLGGGFRVSPDGQWLAIIEEHNAHLLPFPRTGRLVKHGPKQGGMKQVRVSENSAASMHFSGNDGRFHWVTGPELYSVSVKDTMAATEFDAAQVEGVSLTVSRPADAHEGVGCIEGARVVTMNGEEVLETGTVVWQGKRIVSVGPKESVQVPAGAYCIAGEGLTVIPGLVDVHYHGSQGTTGLIPEQNWSSYSALSFGVTTVHDPSNNTEEVFAASELQRLGRILGPRLFSTGTILYGAKSPGYTAEVNNLEQALTHLRRMKAVGAISVKSYNQPRRDQRQQILEAGRQTGVMVVPEGGSLMMHNLTQIVDGHTGIEHAVPVAPLYDDVLQLWSQTQVGYTPTLGVSYGGLSGEKYWYAHTDVWADERLAAFVPQRVVDPSARRPEHAPEEEYHHITVSRSVKALHDLGVGVQIGAHGQREGLAAHWELWMMEQGGMTPHQAIRVGTLEGAEYLGLDNDIGSVTVGKLADFAVIEGNPLKDLSLSKKVRWTVLGGRVFDASTLHQVFPDTVERQPFYFEQQGHNQQPTVQHAHACGCSAP